MKNESNSLVNNSLYSTEYRFFDSRLGRWMSLDPLMDQFPWMSPFVGMDNNPISLTDPLGLSTIEKDVDHSNTGNGLGEKNDHSEQKNKRKERRKQRRDKNKDDNQSKPGDKVLELGEVYIIGRQKVAEPIKGWKRVLTYFGFNRRTVNSGTSLEMSIDNDGYTNVDPVTGTPPDIGFSSGFGGFKRLLNILKNPKSTFKNLKPLYKKTDDFINGVDVAAKGVGSFFEGGRIAKGSELVGYAKQQGWKATQSAGGPLKYVDANGVIRKTIKQGSQRATGSGFPHVELRNTLGKRIQGRN